MILRSNRVVGVLAALGVLAAALLFGGRPAAAAPLQSQGSPSLVISEVYDPVGGDQQAQWFEVHNVQPAIAYPLNGLIVATGGNQMTISTTAEIAGSGYALFVFDPDAVGKGLVTPVDSAAPVISVQGLGGLDPQADALILYTPDKFIIDEVNWGTPKPDWVNYDPGVFFSPGLAPLQPGEGSWGRTPEDRDTNGGHVPAGDWTRHATPSPGGALAAVQASDFLLGWTNIAGGLSSLLLWAAFIAIAIIAYRFERRHNRATYWQLLLLAPSGILFYTVIVIREFSVGRTALTSEEKWLSFPVLAVSALFCLVAVGIFRNAVRSLPEGN
ncbi:MAG: hypothetical protein ACR2M0_13230 [Chloroflexia bacterium]